MTEYIKVDNTSFNKTHYENFTEEDFIKDQIKSVINYYGDEKGKIKFLKEAFKKIQKEKPKK